MKTDETPIIELTGETIKKRALLQAVSELADPKFKVPNGFVIPLGKQIYVKKEVGQKGLNETEGGIILPETVSSNTVIPNVGIVYAVGPEVNDFIFPGLKVCYQEYDYFEVMIKGISYLRMYDHELLGILPPESYVYQGVRSEAYLRRVSKMKMWAEFHPKNELREENKTDKAVELSKKKK